MKEAEKLIITKPVDKAETQGCMLRVNEKAYALLTDLAAKSGRSRSYIANLMIEYAYERVQIREVDADGSG